jgi:hypothetical protein
LRINAKTLLVSPHGNTVLRVFHTFQPCEMIPRIGACFMLERRIRELCAQAVTTQDADTLRCIMEELRDALHEHNEELKRALAEYPFLLDDLSKPAA